MVTSASSLVTSRADRHAQQHSDILYFQPPRNLISCLRYLAPMASIAVENEESKVEQALLHDRKTKNGPVKCEVPSVAPITDRQRDGEEDDESKSSASSKSTAAISMPYGSTQVLLPWLPSLRHGRQTKSSAREVASWVALALSLDGRDKLTKVAQYLARFLAWWWAGQGRAARFLDLKNSLTTSRKAFRLGRSLIELHRLQSLGLLAAWRRHLSRAQWIVPQSMCHHGGCEQPSGAAPSLSPLELVGTTVKLLGLAGFWAADNISFLVQSGLWDDYAVSPETRVKQRLQWQSRASRWANRSYFAGAVAGLLVSAKAYLHHRQRALQAAETADGAPDVDSTEKEAAAWERARERQFALFVALLKSCCDVLVFSNNPGLDFWRKHSGRPLHEGIHCLCGLASATTVLYNSFPNDTPSGRRAKG